MTCGTRRSGHRFVHLLQEAVTRTKPGSVAVVALVLAVGTSACAVGARPVMGAAGQPEDSHVPTTATMSFGPDVTVVLAPSPTTTTTQPAASPAPVPTTTIASPVVDDPGPPAVSSPVAEAPPVEGTITAPSLGTQAIAPDLERGARIQARTGCGLLISGHRTSGPAPFAAIDQLAPGDPVTVTLADGSSCDFVVERLELLDEVEAYRRVNFFDGADNAGALYACADETGAPGGLSHRWWVTLVADS